MSPSFSDSGRLYDSSNRSIPPSRDSLGPVRQIANNISKKVEFIRIDFDFYATSFCTKADLLSQWRGYGSG